MMIGCMNANNRNIALCPGLQQLKNEHVSLLAMLEELRILGSSLVEKETDINAEFNLLTEKLQLFYRDLGPHSEKEENVLFRMMEKYLPKSGGPIEVMEDEHNRARALIHHYLDETNEEKLNLSDEVKKQLAGSLVKVHTILTDHFAKEENVLFPMAERMFSDAEKQILNEKLIP